MKKPKCQKCQNEMEKGVARPEGGYTSSNIKWGKEGIDFLGRTKNGIDVDTFRCKSCGYLESYANSDHE
jgi:hypothetical protein